MSDCQHPCCDGTCTNPRHRCVNATPNPTRGGTRLCGLHLRGLQADIHDTARVTALIPPTGGTDGMGRPVRGTGGGL